MRTLVVSSQHLSEIRPAPWLVIPVISGCFNRSRSPYLMVVLVVSVPAPNISVTVAIKFSIVNSDC
jgi:hypothetical protein